MTAKAKRAGFVLHSGLSPLQKARARYLAASQEWEKACLKMRGPTPEDRARWEQAKERFDRFEHAHFFGGDNPPADIQPDAFGVEDPLSNPPQYTDAPDWWPASS